MNVIKHNIDWLEFLNNKLVVDDRGFLWEIVPWWMNNSFLWWELWHIYASVATGKHIPRWWHYHFKNIDRFATLSGSALWFFVDYRESKRTFFCVILGKTSFPNNQGIPSYTIDNNFMLAVKVPPWVYHAFVPLTQEEVLVMSLASQEHDDSDYERISLFDIPEIEDILHNFWIQW